MWKITDFLYLAQQPMIDGVTRKDNLKKHDIKLVLTVASDEIEMDERVEGVDYMFVEMMDTPRQDILTNGKLKKCLELIRDYHKEKKNVVVHCLAAISRSVTICVAHLMLTRKWKTEEALEFVRKIREDAEPNPGFIAQLRVWESNSYSFDVQYANGSQFLQTPEDRLDKTRYKCQKCRKLLFTEVNILHGFSHEECVKYLIEPMIWLRMDKDTNNITHSCGRKLGQMITKGSKCTYCSSFVSPWIHVDKSRVDEIKPIE